MRKLTAQSPIVERTGAEQTILESPDLHMRETSLLVLGIRVPRAESAGDIGARLGISLPSSPNSALNFGNGWLVCTEPNAWRVLSAPGTHRELVAALAGVTTACALVTDLGSAFCVLELRGAGARNAIASGCPLDLHERVFKTGSAANSRFVDLPVQIVKTSDEPAFLICCERSHALTGWDWLAAAVALF